MADSTAADETEQQVTFTVKSSVESKYALTLPVSTTIGDVKQKLSTAESANLPPARQRLIYSGRVLKDHDTIASCKIKDGNTVHLVKGADSNARQNPTNTASSAAASTTPGAGSQAASNVPTNIAAGTGASNPLAHLTGARYAGLHGLPGMDTFGADGGMGAPPDPDSVLRMLENPMFASQMNEALNNPAVLDMLRNNPMVRNNPMMRQALENPEFRRMMLNPEMLRWQLQMQRAMGGGGGIGGGDGGFPMPGETDTTETPSTRATGDAANQAASNPAPGAGSVAPPANPFAALFPGGADGAMGGQQQPGGAQQNNPLASMTQHLMQNPEAMQQMMGMMGMGGAAAGGGDDANNTGAAARGGGAGAGANPFGGFNPFMYGDFGGAPLPQQPQQPPDNRPPEERYEQQLRQLNDMGFYDFDRNVQALRRSGGSVQGAVNELLSNP